MSEDTKQLATGGRVLRKLHTQWGIAFPHEGVREVLGGSKKFIGTNLFSDLEVGVRELEAWANALTSGDRRDQMKRFSRLQTEGIAYLRRVRKEKESGSVDRLFALLWLSSGIAYKLLFPKREEEPIFPELAIVPAREKLIQTCSEFFPSLRENTCVSDLEAVFQEIIRKPSVAQ